MDIQKYIFEQRQNGVPYAKVADYLNISGHTTVKGRRFTPSNVKNIFLRNPNYKNYKPRKDIIRVTYDNAKQEQYKGEERIKFAVVSDTHLCSKYQQLTHLKAFYERCKADGIKTVYHCGDLCDGYYPNRSEQIYELYKIGFDDQLDYIVDKYPKVDGIKTKIISGNHDHTHIRNSGANIVKAVCKEHKDFEYLGAGYAKVWITPQCDVDLMHPIDGSAFTLSYALQRTIDAMQGGSKPKILFVGHHHKAFYMPYRNIHAFEAGGFQAQTPFMRG